MRAVFALLIVAAAPVRWAVPSVIRPATGIGPVVLTGLPPLPSAPGVSSGADLQVIDVVNVARGRSRRCAERAFAAAPSVAFNDRLAYVARIQALDMALHDYVGHTGRDRSTPAQRVDRVGYRWSAVGENVAGGPRTAGEVVEGWLGSPGHCSVIMTQEYSEAGAAWASSPGRYRMYWALVMARPR